jgi:phosphatidylinositol-3-phosphatase
MPHPMSRHITAVTVACLVATLAAGCASPPTPAADGPRSVATPAASAPAATSHAPELRANAGSGPEVGKMLVFVVENHAMSTMLDHMPFVRELATTYGYADYYDAVTHPSLPNYLAVLGGQTFGVTDDEPPAVHAASGPSVFGAAIAAGRTAKLYAEGMPGPCTLTSGPGDYAVKHNPWAYFADERELCQTFDVPLPDFAKDAAGGSLPTVGMVVPDMCNDAHNCSLATADTWLGTQLEQVLAGPDWASGRLAIVITADEDDRHHDNRVLTVVAHPALQGKVVTTNLTHFSLSRALAEVAGVPALSQAADATSLLTAFALRPAS